MAALDHLRRKAPLASFLAAEHVARQDDLHGLALAHRAGQTLRRSRAGDHTELDLGLPELGVRRAVQDVAHEGELAAAAQREARDRGDNGLADVVGQVRPGRDEVLGVCGGKGEGGHFLDVGAS